MLTDDQLHRIMPNLVQAKRQLYLPFLNVAMHRYGIDNAHRTAAFAAQLAHESAEFRFMEEIWGPIAQQLRYEPPSDLARRLGNAQAGDGKRFKGRGPIQITGRFNYKKYGDLLDIDLCAAPDRAADPAVAFSTAGLFWTSNGLNELADAGDFITITKRINGGTTGLPDRQMYYARAQSVLASGFVAGDGQPPTRGPRAAPPRLPDAPLTRGFELYRDEVEADTAEVATAGAHAAPAGRRSRSASTKSAEAPASDTVAKAPARRRSKTSTA